MDFNTFQEKAWGVLKPGLSHEQKVWYFNSKLSEEVGEIVGPLAKTLIHGKPLPENHIINELGDLLYYIAVMAKEFSITLDDIAQFNVDKLSKRHGKEYNANYYEAK